MASKIPLGDGKASGLAVTMSKDQLSNSQRIDLLEQQIDHMRQLVNKLKDNSLNAYEPAQVGDQELNKDGLPVGLECWGKTENNPFIQYITVVADGYMIGNTKYGSLSAAAEAVSGVRRSGWTFWKLWQTGESLKEVYKT